MLQSELEERGRRFTLALRAGIPVIILTSLVFITTIYNEKSYIFTLKDSVLLAALTFITIYFIYFFMNLSVQETLIDSTTQSFNKKTFVKKLEQSKPKTLACLNIANLQSLNENYSSDQIDDLLYSTTRKLNLLFKQHGIHKVDIGRIRGSEFLIAIDEHNDDVKEILTSFIKKHQQSNEMEIDYRLSVITNASHDFRKNISQLRDILTIQATSHETTETLQDAKELSEIETSVISALKNKNLLLSFRPVLNANTNTIDIYEIAIKLKSLQHENILPRTFLPIVNRLGMGREYDFTLIKHVIDLLPLVDKSVSFTFNISPFSLRDKTFQEKVFDYIKKSNIDPSRIIIQLYERKTHHDLSGYLKTLSLFRVQGFQICIDNFGSSNASMEYIKHFKFDMVQFDRDYVTNLENKTTYAMLQSLIKMSKDLEVKTIGKWVDNDRQKKDLKHLGIDYMQGFGISKPITEEMLIHRYN
jgi:EAL domain-containing protein (putative c-di-GMP-specific phosphodiesterase class I)